MEMALTRGGGGRRTCSVPEGSGEPRVGDSSRICSHPTTTCPRLFPYAPPPLRLALWILDKKGTRLGLSDSCRRLYIPDEEPPAVGPINRPRLTERQRRRHKLRR